MIDRLKRIRLRYYLLAILILIFSLLMYQRSNAVSIYDDNYQLAEEAIINNTTYPNCSVNISANWYSTALGLLPSEEEQDHLKNAVENGMWSVSTLVQSNDGVNISTFVEVNYNTDPNNTIEFLGSVVQANSSNGGQTFFRKIRIGILNSSCTLAIFNGVQTSQNVVISSNGSTSQPPAITDYFNLVTGGNYTINYPQDYAGLPIRAVYTPPNTYYPQFEYTVESLYFNAQYLYNVPYEDNGLSNLRWRVVGQDLNGDYNQILSDVTQDEEQLFEYTFALQGDYEIWLDFVISPPGILTPPDKVETTVQRIAIDGRSYSSSTLESECFGGVCNQPTIYEDCSISGFNIGEAVSCAFRNFGVFLRSMLVNLFVPSSLFLQNYFNNIKNFLEEKLGLLVYPIFFITDLVGDIVAEASSPSCTFDVNGNFFGSPVPDYDICVLENAAPTLYNTFVGFIRGAVVFGMIFALWRKLMGILRGTRE